MCNLSLFCQSVLLFWEKKDTQQEFQFKSFQNQKQKLTNTASQLRDKMAMMVLIKWK